MTISVRALGVGPLLLAASVALLSSCVFDGSEDPPAGEEETDPAPGVSVEIPAARLTPFCQAMTDLSDRVRSGEAVDDAEIVETYRSISGDVPAVIADDFALVLQALETGAPAPTDPPRATIQTVPRPSTAPPTTGATTDGATTDGETAESGTSVPGSVVVDERFDRDDSPAQRINSYVSFTCRDADNNPGPPATQPLEGPPPTAD